MIARARRVSLRVLRQVGSGRVDLPDAQTAARAELDDARDRALASDIVLGTLRWRTQLDHVVDQLSSRPRSRIDDGILDLLRMSLYQLMHLERVPAHAVVNDAVQLARHLGKRSAAPYVNAVLRAFQKSPRSFSLPARPTTATIDIGSAAGRTAALDYLSITMSHPRWLVERWLDRVGLDATDRWVAFNNRPAPVTLRVNPLRGTPDRLIADLREHQVDVIPGRYSPLTLVVERGNPLATPLADDGAFWLQDEASQLVGELIARVPNERVLDLCAAPGGKSLIVATATRGFHGLVSGDRSAERVRVLATTLDRLAAGSASVVRLDARFPPCGPVFDWVVLDTPCTGLGTLRRHPDIRWRRSPADIARMATLQGELIRGAAHAVRPGGRLVYATCSTEPEENRTIVERFLREHPDFRAERPRNDRLAPLIAEDGCFETLPFRDQLGGFFAAILTREIS